jgi:hypothetical protein
MPPHPHVDPHSQAAVRASLSLASEPPSHATLAGRPVPLRRFRAPVPLSALGLFGVALGVLACKLSSTDAVGVPPKQLADAVHAVLEADRAVYTREVVNRLQNELGVIKASEHWKEDKTLPLPAQMFRMGAELAAQKDAGLHYALLSPWPISRQNLPRTDVEKAGLDFVVKNPSDNYYGSERLGDTTFFTAVYPDKAIANACIECHNQHASSPRRDFALGDVMGGVVVRIAQR